jgi:hypothetical protein
MSAFRSYISTDEKRRYHREYMRARRAGMRHAKPEATRPDPTKPTKELRRKDPKQYMRLYMRWWRANGYVRRGADPEGKDWWR